MNSTSTSGLGFEAAYSGDDEEKVESAPDKRGGRYRLEGRGVAHEPEAVGIALGGGRMTSRALAEDKAAHRWVR